MAHRNTKRFWIILYFLLQGVFFIGAVIFCGCGSGGAGGDSNYTPLPPPPTGTSTTSPSPTPSSTIPPPDQFFVDLQNALNGMGNPWTAGQNEVSTSPARNQLCGLNGAPVRAFRQPSLHTEASRLPGSFTWTDEQGYDWMGPVKNQRSQSTGVAFALIGALEAKIKITEDIPTRSLNLSEWYMFRNGGGSTDSGWNFDTAFQFMQTTGTVLECFCPYTDAVNYYPEKSAKANRYRITGFSWVPATRFDIKLALRTAPVVAGMVVYKDFFYYKEGVYSHVLGDQAGYQAVIIEGWDDSKQSWICRNSWGTNWGEGGEFYIRYGECSIENWVLQLDTIETPQPLVAFVSDRSFGVENIFVMKTDGTNVQQVTNFVEGCTAPAFSPDYSKIVFKRGINSGDICTVNVDGTGYTNVTQSPVYLEDSPCWSADGFFLGYVKRTGFNNIIARNCLTNTETILTTAARDHGSPHFAPDFSKVVFTALFGPDNDLFTRNLAVTGNVNPDTVKPGASYSCSVTSSNERQLTNDGIEDSNPFWSPKADRITFTTFFGGNREIYLINPDGTGLTRMTNNPADDYGGPYSHDGTQLIFASSRDGNGGEIYKMNSSGVFPAATRLTTNPAFDKSPTW